MSNQRPKIFRRLILVLVAGLPLSFPAKGAAGSPASHLGDPAEQVFPARGVVLEVRTDDQTVVIRHAPITNYMSAMTMPFSVRAPAALTNLSSGDEVTFQLHVTSSTSWIDQIKRTGDRLPVPERKPAVAAPSLGRGEDWSRLVKSGSFTNELGQPVNLDDYRGQALAVTFFYTRCPLPNFCPRLSKNFQEAAQKLAATPNAPTNWHFLSISFDPEFDTPERLRNSGQSYQYDPAHWSFLTGSPDKIAALAKTCGLEYRAEDGTINHNFRTIIVDTTGRVRMVFPFTGNFSDALGEEMLGAARVTNQARSRIQE